MADFKEAFKLTMGHEGEYSFDPDDAGGETYRGISRRYHPNWEGWIVIDGRNKNIEKIKKLNLNSYVMEFYKEYYWNKFLGNEILSQNIADEMFDTSVNLGIEKSVIFLQEALNYLNRNELLYPDLVVDGVIGNNTMNALDAYLQKDKEVYLLKIMNILQGMHYLNFMKKSPTQEKYCRGWLNRVEISKI